MAFGLLDGVSGLGVVPHRDRQGSLSCCADWSLRFEHPSGLAEKAAEGAGGEVGLGDVPHPRCIAAAPVMRCALGHVRNSGPSPQENNAGPAPLAWVYSDSTP
jgi:hypothetical protein